MKYLLFLAIVLMAIWLLRSGRRRVQDDSDERPSEPPASNAPQEMVRCGVCGTHLPQSEAIVGRLGVYCSQEHRQIAEP